MKKLAFIAFYAAPVVLSVSIFLASSSWSQTSPAQGPKIGVVNVNTIFTDSVKIKDYKESMQQVKDTEQKIMEGLRTKLEGLSKEIEAIKTQLQTTPNSYDLKLKIREKNAALASAKSELDFRLNSWNEFIEKDISGRITTIYKDINLVIGEYAVSNGYDFVLKIDDDPNSPETIFNEDRIDRRDVLFFNKFYDITDQILKKLDTK
ncbi:MAG: OmpH family outer membrane protein [Planctomycetes bacterium]|nr:OmpH family outer membrane protein [Planctomycetota bacterium]